MVKNRKKLFPSLTHPWFGFTFGISLPYSKGESTTALEFLPSHLSGFKAVFSAEKDQSISQCLENTLLWVQRVQKQRSGRFSKSTVFQDLSEHSSMVCSDCSQNLNISSLLKKNFYSGPGLVKQWAGFLPSTWDPGKIPDTIFCLPSTTQWDLWAQSPELCWVCIIKRKTLLSIAWHHRNDKKESKAYLNVPPTQAHHIYCLYYLQCTSRNKKWDNNSMYKGNLGVFNNAEIL